MNLTLIADRVPSGTWALESLAGAVARLLGQRGHAVTLVCDSCEDPAALGPRVTVKARQGFCHRDGGRSTGLRGFARAILNQRPAPHAVASFSRLAPAEVWMPLEPAAWTALGRMRRLASTDAVVGEGKSLPRMFLASRAETRGQREAWCVRRMLVFGRDAARGVVEAMPVLEGRVEALGPLVTVKRPGAGELAELRRATREMLSVSEGQTLVLGSAAGGVERDLRALMEAAAHVHRRLGSAGEQLVLAIVAPDLYSAHRLAAKAGVTRAVRLVQPTRRFEGLLAAADVCAVVRGSAVDAFEEAGAGRFVGEAMTFSRPVLAVRGVGGAGGGGTELLATKPAPGMLVADANPTDWYVALAAAMDPSWRIAAGIAARAVADVHTVTTEMVADRVEKALAGAAVALAAGALEAGKKASGTGH